MHTYAYMYILLTSIHVVITLPDHIYLFVSVYNSINLSVPPRFSRKLHGSVLRVLIAESRNAR